MKSIFKNKVLIDRETDIFDIKLGHTSSYLQNMREKYQIKLNDIKKKYQIKIEKNSNDKNNLIALASQDEMKLYRSYIEEVKQYLYGTPKRKTLKDFGNEQIKDEIVLCIDTSWSMYDLVSYWFGKQNKIIFDVIKDVYSFINLLDMKKTRISIVSFGKKSQTIVPLSNSKPFLFLKLISLFPSHGFATTFSWIFKYDRYNHDDASIGLRESASVLLNSENEDSTKAIVYFTDEKFDGVDRASTDYAITQKDKLYDAMKSKFIEHGNAISSLGINIFTYEKRKDLNKVIDKEVNLVVDDLLDKVFFDIPFEKKDKKSLRHKVEYHQAKIPELSMYFTHLRGDINVKDII